eukprot:374829_1
MFKVQHNHQLIHHFIFMLLWHLHQCQVTVIHKHWDDDFAYDSNGRTGWFIFTTKSSSPNPEEFYTPENPIINSSFNTYHGVLKRHRPYTWFIRSFQCSRDSEVLLSFSVAFCGTDSYDTTEAHALNSYSNEVMVVTMQYGGNPYLYDIDPQIEFIAEPETQGFCYTHDWRYERRDYVSLGSTTALTEWEMAMTVEHGSIYAFAMLFDVSIDCYAPTLAPTTEPSKNPTKSPTTSSPTFNPSSSPTTAPTMMPTPSPSFTPTSAPTNAPTVIPTPLGPTPSPTNSNNQIFVNKNGCDCNKYCVSNSSACLTLQYAYNCFMGYDNCSSKGYDGNGILYLGYGEWYWPTDLLIADTQVIFQGNGMYNTVLKQNDLATIGCKWYKCWLQFNDLTLSTNVTITNNNSKQINTKIGGTLKFKNVLFDGNNYNMNQNGDRFWNIQDNRMTVIFENCIFRNNNVFYKIWNGAYVEFINCYFEDNNVNLSLGFTPEQ